MLFDVIPVSQSILTVLLSLLCLSTATADIKNLEVATFAGGCFWCVEHDFEKIDGVKSVVSGYTGGDEKEPTYDQVSSGQTGHVEAIEILFDPKIISFKKLLDIYWRSVDPTVKNRQFCDVGKQYRSVIFYHGQIQEKLAKASKNALLKSKKFERIETDILPAKRFYPAEEYHQNYAKKNPIRYNYYRFSCGRDKRLKSLWGDEKS